MLTYDNFIEQVNNAGFWTPFTYYISPEIFTYAHGGHNITGQAYTDNPDTDTELWKIRAPAEKKLAYGFYFNGKRGYIAPRFYSIFIDAFRPRMTIAERCETGKLGEYEKAIWDLLISSGKPLSWSDIRKNVGLEPASKYNTELRQLESALKSLQMTFDITIDGTVGYLGCTTVDGWIPQEWLDMNPRMEQKEALEAIYRQAEKISITGNARKAFAKSLKLYKSFT